MAMVSKDIFSKNAKYQNLNYKYVLVIESLRIGLPFACLPVGRDFFI
jgi:hypothetical protein